MSLASQQENFTAHLKHPPKKKNANLTSFDLLSKSHLVPLASKFPRLRTFSVTKPLATTFSAKYSSSTLHFEVQKAFKASRAELTPLGKARWPIGIYSHRSFEKNTEKRIKAYVIKAFQNAKRKTCLNFISPPVGKGLQLNRKAFKKNSQTRKKNMNIFPLPLRRQLYTISKREAQQKQFKHLSSTLKAFIRKTIHKTLREAKDQSFSSSKAIEKTFTQNPKPP